MRWLLLVSWIALGCGDPAPAASAAEPAGPDFTAPVPSGYVLPEPGPETAVCIGPSLPQSAWEADPGPILDPDAEPGDPGPEDLPLDEAPPFWQLRNFQPQSCGFGAVLGLQAFEGRVTVVGLHAAW